MFRTRFAILTMSTALACCSSAVACEGGMAHEFLVNGAKIAAGEKVEVRGTGGFAVEATVASLATHVRCDEGLLPVGTANVLEEAGKFKSKLELKACTSTIVSTGTEEDEPKCKVANFNVENTGELTEAGIATISGAAAEKVFAEIVISEVAGAGACALAGTYKLKGTTACDIPDYLVTIPGIFIGCDPLGSKEIKLGTESAKLDLPLGIEGTKGQTFSSN